MSRIFLDHNSTTRPLPEVVETVARHARDSYANPGSRHAEGRVARRALEDSREKIAALLSASPKEVIFTSGGTEAINLAIFGLAREQPAAVLLTAGEHPAVRQACARLHEQGWQLEFLDVDRDGRIIVEQLDQLPWHKIALATVILAHNETGVVQDVSPLAKRCQEHGIPLHLDAVQAVGKMPVDFQGLGATALSLGAHKFHGPRGIGAVLLKSGATLRPRQLGGHQESDRRAGTEPVALAVGMAVALEKWHSAQAQREARICDLRDRLERELRTACPGAVVNGGSARRLSNTLNIAFPGVDGDALFVALDLAGVSCSLGSTCASGSTEPPPALIAMGCPPEIVASSVRFSLSFENTCEEIDDAVARIARAVARLRSAQGESRATTPSTDRQPEPMSKSPA
ncbi:MAG TPA: cysteine desulfurase family protein [Planctomycetaceae bacterium]|jgi:cysteine desulfurase|nr:cysteine desulfurase family protein [Planctomycetaceae bacterium]